RYECVLLKLCRDQSWPPSGTCLAYQMSRERCIVPLPPSVWEMLPPLAELQIPCLRVALGGRWVGLADVEILEIEFFLDVIGHLLILRQDAVCDFIRA